jgi:hypothetical protein
MNRWIFAFQKSVALALTNIINDHNKYKVENDKRSSDNNSYADIDYWSHEVSDDHVTVSNTARARREFADYAERLAISRDNCSR